MQSNADLRVLAHAEQRNRVCEITIMPHKQNPLLTEWWHKEGLYCSGYRKA
jgi:hypothetical protein